MRIISKLVFTSLLAGLMSGCGNDNGQSNSPDGKSGPGAKRAHNVECMGTDVQKFFYPDGQTYRQLAESESRANQSKIKISENTMRYETQGVAERRLYELMDDQTRKLDVVAKYKYTAVRTTSTESLGDDKYKEISRIKLKRVGVDGYKFTDGKLEDRSEDETTQEVEETYSLKNGERRTLSLKIDGREAPVFDEVTYISRVDGARIERTVLLSPFTLETESYKLIYESTDKTCRFFED